MGRKERRRRAGICRCTWQPSPATMGGATLRGAGSCAWQLRQEGGRDWACGDGVSTEGKWSRQRIGWGKEENGGQREEGINEKSRRRARSEVVGKRQVSGANTRMETGEGVKG